MEFGFNFVFQFKPLFEFLIGHRVASSRFITFFKLISLNYIVSHADARTHDESREAEHPKSRTDLDNSPH